MTETRSYRQNCSLALSLDLLSERWTLLVVRELGRGPKRFGDLMDALPGLGRSMLATRLKRLQTADVVQPAELASGVAAYGLSDRGERLVHALGELMLWGLELTEAADPEYETRAAWLAMNMQAALRRRDVPPPPGTYAFNIGGEHFYLHVAEREITLRDGAPPHPADATLTADLRTFYELVTGQATLHGSSAAALRGDPTRLTQLFADAVLPAHHATP
jgi:DNA-binding HxlR family transcriptional regulator